MLTKYIRVAMCKAKYEILPDDGTFYGEIVGFDGVYANANTLEACRDELEKVLEGWILLRVSLHFPLPTVDGIEFHHKSEAEHAMAHELLGAAQPYRVGALPCSRPWE